MRFRVSALPVLLTLTVLTAGAQQPPSPIDIPIFRSTVDAIELDAFVVDKDGNPVTDLQAEDFEILEEGQPQPITSFAVIDVPIEREIAPASETTIVSDVRTNERPEGRIYLIAVDEISPSLVANLRLRLRQFIQQHFGPNDSAAIVYVGRGRSADGQDFTSDRTLLLRSIDKLSAGFGSSDLEQASVNDAPEGSAARAIADASAAQQAGGGTGTTGTSAAAAEAAVAQAITQQLTEQEATLRSGQLLDREADYLLRTRMSSLRSLIEFMAGIGGRRKSIIYVTTGLGTSVYEALDYTSGVRSLAIEDLHGAITAATRGNVSIYPMDPAGLTPGRDITASVRADVDPTTEVSQTRIGRLQDLRRLADTTGGFAILDTNNFGEAFDRVVRENSTYYVLGFSTNTPRTDGRFHQVQIRVKRPGLEVRSRGGYLAPLHRKTPLVTRASTLAPTITEALQSPIGITGVPIRLFAAPYKGTGQLARVAITAEFGSEALNLVQKQGRLVGDLAVALRPITAEGKLVAGQRHEMSLALKPETYEKTKTRGVRVVTEMMLAPGRYQLRVAGGPTIGRAGSVTYDLEIPNYAKEPLSMSGVAVTSSTAQETVTIWPGTARPLDSRLPSPMTAARTFWPEETVTLYTEVYEAGKKPTHPVDLKVDLRSDAGRVLSTFSAPHPAAEGGVFSFTAPIKLAGVAPGAYVIHLEATAAKATIARDIPIRVR